MKEKLSNARQTLNLSSRELAERLHTSLYALTRWERGDLVPDPDVVTRLDLLIDPSLNVANSSSNSIAPILFSSSGNKAGSLDDSLCEPYFVGRLESPRASVLSDILNDTLWGDSDLALSDIFQRRDNPALTTDDPLEQEISAGKNTYTYDAHTYHTKVPPQGIAQVISKYLPEGGTVLDPFAGSGMTGVAARHLGCDVILNELSPAASFIAYNFVRRIDTNDFNKAIASIFKRLDSIRKELYSTKCRECGSVTELVFTVWSYDLDCNHCGGTFTLWDHCRKYGKNVKEHKLLRKFPCPHCSLEVNKSQLERRALKPVFIGYRCCSKKIVEHPLDKGDLRRIADAEKILSNYSDSIPKNLIPDGVNLNQPKRHGLDSIDKLYTVRNLAACAAIWHEIRKLEDPEISAAVAFVFTSLYKRITKLAEYRFWGGSSNTANFNVPQISNELNVFLTFKRKAKNITDHFVTTAKNYSGRAVVRTGSATDLSFLPDNSVDLIFTDPPFGGNINYSEMNIIWESWLGIFTDNDHEAIMNKSQGKGIDEYQALMTGSLQESYRVLRPDHWMVLVFMNSSEKVWNALNSAIKDSGFSIEKINIFDKQHGTFKQYVSENTAGADLMIHCKKISSSANKMPLSEHKFVSIQDFIQQQGENIPVVPFLHVNRDEEVDYRTLYSRYIAVAMRLGISIVNFTQFRKESELALRGTL